MAPSKEESPSDSEQAVQDTPPNTGDSEKAKHADLSQRKTVFVRNLAYTTTSESLSKYFSYVAPIKHATIVLDSQTGESRGFGFVTFADPEDARAAVEDLDNKPFEGRRIRVEIAEVRHRDEAGGTLGGERTIGKPEKAKREEFKLIIRNLPWSVKTPEQLTKLFSTYGKVTFAKLPRKDNNPNGLLRGFGFVCMKDKEQAEKAIQMINGKEVNGRTVAVDWAVAKEEYEKEIKEEQKDDEHDYSQEIPEDKDDDDDEDDGEDDEEENEEEDEGSDQDEDGEEDTSYQTLEKGATIFIRNLPYTCEDEDLHAHFTEHFGPVKYARTVIDQEMNRPRGTAFVCFYNEEDCSKCLKDAPRQPPPSSNKPRSILQAEDTDPRYVLSGRVLSITRAVERSEAARLANLSSEQREAQNRDKRRLYLLQEGVIPSNTPLYRSLPTSDTQLREASIKQRKQLLNKNPSLHLSLTRLSVRNLPRSFTNKDLKAIAREAIVGFAADVRSGIRQPLSKEELTRGGDEDRERELLRKKKGKGIVKQAKVMVDKSTGRSMGYGFLEFESHRWALMALRWLNARDVFTTKVGKEKIEEIKRDPARRGEEVKKKFTIIEFAIENVVVVKRRREREMQMRENAEKMKNMPKEERERIRIGLLEKKEEKKRKGKGGKGKDKGNKRKREDDGEDKGNSGKKVKSEEKKEKPKVDEGTARIIAQKRKMRRRKAGKA